MHELINMRTSLKIAVSVLTVLYGLVPLIADLNETHLFNPQWSAHARFHAVWFLAFAAGIAASALYLIWARNEVVLPTVFGIMFSAGFWVALVLASNYGGALVDDNGYSEKIMGVDGNVLVFSALTALFLALLVMSLLRRSGTEKAAARTEY